MSLIQGSPHICTEKHTLGQFIYHPTGVTTFLGGRLGGAYCTHLVNGTLYVLSNMLGGDHISGGQIRGALLYTPRQWHAVRPIEYVRG